MVKRETMKWLHPLGNEVMEITASCYCCSMKNMDNFYVITCNVLDKEVNDGYWCKKFRWLSDDIKYHKAYLRSIKKEKKQ